VGGCGDIGFAIMRGEVTGYDGAVNWKIAFVKLLCFDIGVNILFSRSQFV